MAAGRALSIPVPHKQARKNILQAMGFHWFLSSVCDQRRDSPRQGLMVRQKDHFALSALALRTKVIATKGDTIP